MCYRCIANDVGNINFYYIYLTLYISYSTSSNRYILKSDWPFQSLSPYYYFKILSSFSVNAKPEKITEELKISTEFTRIRFSCIYVSVEFLNCPIFSYLMEISDHLWKLIILKLWIIKKGHKKKLVTCRLEVSWSNIRSTGSVAGVQVSLIIKVHFPLNVQDDPPPHGSCTLTTGTWYTSFPVDCDVEMAGELVVGFGVVGVGVEGALVVLGEGRLVKHIPVGICWDVYFRMKSALSTPLCISYLFRIRYSVPSQFFFITFNFQIYKSNKTK